ncbi:Bug family tripartite tricarboxylate transporter substrate binding protein [Pseudorhodoferax sp.]|uniref:Bug family tripartite tricarboxylate transporter substrate binding protein n=1 Tax=Pseudorhodoferax sp. TaxID=1993553 RepID=UPI002DD68DF1|nr:tripartite tricarboxylate transporter substrate binding protein [Pseudorhodoferax sp.]
MFHRLPLLAAAALLSWLPLAASASDYPTKPIRIVVPYAAGGSTDTLARLVAERLGKQLGQPAVVDNRPGASEQIAISHVAKSAPDGYTLLLSTLSGLAVNPGLYPKLPYDVQKDLTPIVLAATVPSVVVVHPSVPVKTMAELGSYLKSKPGSVSYASAGAGTPSHLGMEYYKRANGVDPVHVPYKGGAPALQEVMGGQVQLMMALVPEAMPMVKGGRLRALAVTSNKRLASYPDLPTVAESGGQDLDVTFWYGFVAPAGTPPAIVAKLNQTINQILAEKDVQAKLAEMNLDVVGGAPAQLTALIKSDAARWKKVIDDAGIKVD